MESERKICEKLSREEIIERHLKIMHDHVIMIQRLNGVFNKPKLVRQQREALPVGIVAQHYIDDWDLCEDYVEKNRLGITTKNFY